MSRNKTQGKYLGKLRYKHIRVGNNCYYCYNMKVTTANAREVYLYKLGYKNRFSKEP